MWAAIAPLPSFIEIVDPTIGRALAGWGPAPGGCLWGACAQSAWVSEATPLPSATPARQHPISLRYLSASIKGIYTRVSAPARYAPDHARTGVSLQLAGACVILLDKKQLSEGFQFPVAIPPRGKHNASRLLVAYPPESVTLFTALVSNFGIHRPLPIHQCISVSGSIQCVGAQWYRSNRGIHHYSPVCQ